tara:strand:+ start:6539 stop:7657 length:1119 start_codon:yes stop_codon:yes gene_type:complete
MLKTIFLFYPSFENGGATKNLINIVNFILKKNIKIILISKNAKKNNFIFSKNLKIINSKPLRIFNFLPIRWNLALSSMIDLNSSIKLHSKNSIIFSMQSHIPAIIIAKLNKIKIILRNSEEPIGATIYADNKILGFLVLILKFIFYNFADKIIAISKRSATSLKKIVISNKKINLIYNPYLTKISKFNKIIKKDKKKFVILSVGRFTNQKNLFPLINVFSNLSKKYYNIELKLVGSGSQRKEIEIKTKHLNNVKIINWQKDIKNIFLKADLFVLNSFYEGLPNVLIDAVNYEIPCISTDVSGARDILLNGNGGYILPINDSNKLRKKIEFVINNYSDSKKKVRIAKKSIRRFSEINLVLFLKTFLKLANHKN